MIAGSICAISGMGCVLWTTSNTTSNFGASGSNSFVPINVLAMGKAMPSNQATKGWFQCRFMASGK
jgi:hypothetical protein